MQAKKDQQANENNLPSQFQAQNIQQPFYSKVGQPPQRPETVNIPQQSGFKRDLMSQIHQSRTKQLPPRPQSNPQQPLSTDKFSQMAEQDKKRQQMRRKKQNQLAMHLKEQIAQRNAKKKKEKEMLEKLELLEEKRYQDSITQKSGGVKRDNINRKKSKKFLREFYNQDILSSDEDTRKNQNQGGNQGYQQQEQQNVSQNQMQHQQQQHQQAPQQQIQQPQQQQYDQQQPQQMMNQKQNYHYQPPQSRQQSQKPPMNPYQQPRQQTPLSNYSNQSYPSRQQTPALNPYSRPLSDEVHQQQTQMYEMQLRLQQQQQEIELKRKEAAMKLAFQQEQQLIQQKALEEQAVIKDYRNQVSNLINEKEGFQSEIGQLKTMLNQLLSKKQTLHLQQQVQQQSGTQFNPQNVPPQQQPNTFFTGPQSPQYQQPQLFNNQMQQQQQQTPYPMSPQQGQFQNQWQQQTQMQNQQLPPPNYTQHNFQQPLPDGTLALSPTQTLIQQQPNQQGQQGQNNQVTHEKILQYIALLGNNILTQGTQPAQHPQKPPQKPQQLKDVPVEESGVLLDTHKLEIPKFEQLEKLRQSMSGTSKLVLLEHGEDLLNKTYQKDLEIMQQLYNEQLSQDPLSEQRATQIRWQMRQNEIIEEESHREYYDDEEEQQDQQQQMQQSQTIQNEGQQQQISDLQLQNQTSETIEMNEDEDDGQQQVFQVEDEADGQDIEIKQEFREQTLYEVMKSHLIPDNKMEELDQDQDNVIENTNTNPFNMIGEGNTNTISQIQGNPAFSVTDAQLQQQEDKDKQPTEEAEDEEPNDSNDSNEQGDDIDNEINAYLRAEKNLIDSGRHTSEAFMSQSSRLEAYQSQLSHIQQLQVKQDLQLSRLPNESKMSEMNPMLSVLNQTENASKMPEEETINNKNTLEYQVIEEDIEENITGIIQSQEKQNIWENEEEQDSLNYDSVEEVESPQKQKGPNVWLQKDRNPNSPEEIIPPEPEFHENESKTDYSHDMAMKNHSYDEDFDYFDSSVKKSKSQQKNASQVRQSKRKVEEFQIEGEDDDDDDEENTLKNDTEGMKNFKKQVGQDFSHPLKITKQNSKMTIGDLSLKEVNSKEIEDFLQSNTDDMIGKQLFNMNNKDFPERPEQILEESKEYLEQAEHYTQVKRREQFHTSLQGRQKPVRISRNPMFNTNYAIPKPGLLSNQSRRFKRPKVVDPFSRGGSRQRSRPSTTKQQLKQSGRINRQQMRLPRSNMVQHQDQLVSQQMQLDMLDNLLEEIEDDKTQELQFSDNKRQSQPIRTMKSEKKKQRQFQYTSMNVPSNKAPVLFKPLSKTRKYSKSKRYQTKNDNQQQ